MTEPDSAAAVSSALRALKVEVRKQAKNGYPVMWIADRLDLTIARVDHLERELSIEREKHDEEAYNDMAYAVEQLEQEKAELQKALATHVDSTSHSDELATGGKNEAIRELTTYEAAITEQLDRIEALLNDGQNNYERFHCDVAAILGYGTDQEQADARMRSEPSQALSALTDRKKSILIGRDDHGGER